MTDQTIFPSLKIPETLAAGPGPGNTDARVLQAFAQAGVWPTICRPTCCVAWSSARKCCDRLY